MSGDIGADRDFQLWAKDVRDNLVPRLADSAVMLSMVPRGDADVKYAVELGLSIMMDKPIVLLVQPGAKLPSKLVRVADDIVEIDLGRNPAAAKKAIDAALTRLHENGII